MNLPNYSGLSVENTEFDCNGIPADGLNFPYLHFACFRGELDIAKALVKKGANPYKRSIYGGTPLYLAARGGRPKVVKWLLSLDGVGKTINWQKRNGWTALNIATYHYLNVYMGRNACDWKKVIDILLENYADPYICTHGGLTAIDLAKDTILADYLARYHKLNELKEWRPWNHQNYVKEYRDAVSCLNLLAKI